MQGLVPLTHKKRGFDIFFNDLMNVKRFYSAKVRGLERRLLKEILNENYVIGGKCFLFNAHVALWRRRDG